NNTFYADALADGIIRPNEDIGAYRSQLLNSHNGKLLRINPDNGDGVFSNPFFEEAAPRSAKSRVYAFGFRNPFRMSLKPGVGSTNPSAGDVGEVFIGDVGWGAWEELNIVTRAGTNFGWPLYEGNSPVPSYNDYGIENRDETYFPNCRPTGYMTFNKMIVQDNADRIANLHNPCDVTQINATGRRYLHARPALDWGRNPGNTRVSRFNSSGVATSPTIGTPESNVAADSTFTGNASAGGVWFTNSNNTFPPEYSNTFLLSDFGGQKVKRIGIEFSDVVTSVDDFIKNASTVVSMAENPLDGSLVYVTVGSLSAPSTVKRVIYGGNIPPVAKISADNKFSENSTLSVNFTGDQSSDQDGTITIYNWDFGDVGHPDNLSALPNPTHTYVATPGVPRKYEVKLTVTDDLLAVSEEEKFIVSVNNTPPQVRIISPVNNSEYTLGSDTIYTLMADVSDDQQSPGQLTYAWQTALVHNNHSHPGPIDNDVQTTANISRIGCNDDYSWKIQLTVTDDAGLSTTDASEIFPNCETTLPLILHKFSVTQRSSENVVKWTTELESNIDYFEVERSTDGVNFSPINRQYSRNVAGTSHYSFSDGSFPPGYNYYRLKIVEHGSIIRYSVVVRTVSESENLNLKIVPNPVIGNFSVMYKSFQDDRVTIRIRDITGRVIHTISETVSRGQNVIYLQNLPNWSAGVYFLSIQNKDEIKQAKFIKSR
ncbi:MAG: PKD domain-containing protein, partial [Chitinophagaceae bacterium]